MLIGFYLLFSYSIFEQCACCTYTCRVLDSVSKSIYVQYTCVHTLLRLQKGFIDVFAQDFSFSIPKHCEIQAFTVGQNI